MAVWQPLVVCGRSPVVAHVKGTPLDLTNTHIGCEFPHAMLLVKNLITDLVLLATFAAVAVFIYAGIILLTSGGNPSAKDRAKDMFFKTIIGFLWILGAWLVVYTITNALVDTDKYPTLLGAPTQNQ